MKKILLISNMYPSKKYKHYGVFVENTYQMLVNGGYHVDISVLKKKESKIGKVFGCLFYLRTVILVMLNRYDYLYAHYISHTALLVKIIHKLKPKTKLIINVHGNDVLPEDKHDEKFIPIVRDVLKIVDICIVPSKYFYKVMYEQYDFPKERLKIFPSGGVNLKIFHKIPEAKEMLGLENKPTLGYIGRYETKKGWELFVEAANYLKNKGLIDSCNVLMVGTGADESNLDNLIKKYHLEKYIARYPMQNQKELAKFYSAIDIFCFPTYRHSESLGLVGLEAMSCGSIVVASNMAGPTSYLVDNVNGFMFEPKNVNDLTEKIEKTMFLSEEKQHKIKENAYLTVKEYDSKNIEQILLDIFNSIN